MSGSNPKCSAYSLGGVAFVAIERANRGPVARSAWGPAAPPWALATPEQRARAILGRPGGEFDPLTHAS